MLFSSGADGQVELASLSRNEIIALVNTAAQLAKSVGSVPEWRWLGEFLLSHFIMWGRLANGGGRHGSAAHESWR